MLRNPRAVQVQFRYGFVCDDEGIKVLDVTQLDHPRLVAALALAEANNIYLARTYAYVAAGSQGLVILDITNPTQPRVDQVFNAGGRINDLCDVKLGITNASEFAYLADGCNGLRVVQLTSPETPAAQASVRAQRRSSWRITSCTSRGAPWRFPRAWIETVPSTSPATRSRCSAASARDR